MAISATKQLADTDALVITWELFDTPSSADVADDNTVNVPDDSWHEHDLER